MSTAFQRIDDKGRVTIPSGLRKNLGWECGAMLIAKQEGNTIVFNLQENAPKLKCAYCGRPESRIYINGIDICSSCLEMITEVLAAKNNV